ncbi:MAG: hypothetical protein J7K98_00475 [Candidatus Aenigmarchaeota archaeon]|nr:hypothetical protein [Candidatus Aenigmarchaeota archaeon]
MRYQLKLKILQKIGESEKKLMEDILRYLEEKGSANIDELYTLFFLGENRPWPLADRRRPYQIIRECCERLEEKGYVRCLWREQEGGAPVVVYVGS